MRKILQQTSWLFLAQVISRVISFFYVIFLARNLGVSDFGLYTTALVYFYFFSAIVDFGFNRFLIREVAKSRSKIVELFSSISLFRLTLTSLVYALFALTLYFFDPDKSRVNISLLLVLAILPQTLGQTIDSIFIAIQKLQLSATSILAASLVAAVSGVVLVGAGFGPTGAAVAFILGQLIYSLTLLYLLQKLNIKFLSYVTLPILKRIISGSFFYGILIILGLIYFRIDILLLSYLKGNFDTGIYGAGYRFLEVALIIPTALSTVIFPHFSRLNKEKSRDLFKLYKKSVLLLLALSFFIALAFWMILPGFIKIFLPSYALSIDVVKILALSIPFFFISSLQATFLMSCEKLLNHLIGASIFMICFIVSLNLILIPKYSFVGAAWVTVISETMVVLIFSVLIKKTKVY